MEKPTPEPGASPTLPENFLEQVRQSLEHIYDMSSLINKPLRFPGSGALLSGKSLKIELIRMIESLNPGTGFILASREARPYHLLNLRYIQKMGIEEIASRLNISVRQAYRDLRAGEEHLAALLWESKNEPDGDASTAGDLSLNSELSRMPSNLQTIDLVEVVRSAGQVTGELAYERQVIVRLVGMAQSFLLTADPTVAQQVMVSLLSHTIRQATAGSTIEVIFHPQPPSMKIQYCPEPQRQAQHPMSELIYQLAERLNWSLNLAESGLLQAIGLQEIGLDFHQKPKTILIVEDNEGVVELFRRYLTDQPVSIVSSNSSPEGLRLANELPIDLILLDVMMQDLDGWEFLRRLKREPRTAAIPVIVCSVFFEPDLARSLGATGFLPKPVTQQSLLVALGEVGIL